MGKYFTQLIMTVIIFTALFFTFSCTKDEGNKAPNIPLNISPLNNDTNVSVLPTLAWSACSDPDNDTVKYDIYLGSNHIPPLYKSNILLNSFKPDTLSPFSKYYWMVVAKDNKNNSASSAIWSFTTGMPIAEPGDIKVMVCNATQTIYYLGAEVFLYRTENERMTDYQRTNYYRKANTDNLYPTGIGAVFYAVPFQKYYGFGRKDKGGGDYLTGVFEGYVIPGNTVTFILVVM